MCTQVGPMCMHLIKRALTPVTLSTVSLFHRLNHQALSMEKLSSPLQETFFFQQECLYIREHSRANH